MSAISRRRFLKLSAAGTGAAWLGLSARSAQDVKRLPEASARNLPPWRGFNLLEKFYLDRNQPFREQDFELIAGLDFNFVRLPMSYRCWTEPGDWRRLKEPVLKEIDAAVDFGKRYGVHVNLNFHRAPGYCVNAPAEPFDLWKDEEALDACTYHWTHFARRYRGVANTDLSFNLLNEPGDVPEAVYARVVKRLVEAIRAEDQDRLIIADGLRWAKRPVPALEPLRIAQSTHCYSPKQLTHYQASWVQGADEWPKPAWPLSVKEHGRWDKARLRRTEIETWAALSRRGVGVQVGEWGAYNRTPHGVVLAWMQDQLDLFKEAGWGWALWNFRGSFGILDSHRADVHYEEWRGHRLDRRMLELLQKG